MTLSLGTPPGEPAETMTPAEREARWALSVRFAIEAASEAQARAILGQALTSLDRELPLQGEPTIAPLRIRDGIWVVTLMPDLTGLASVEPDDARNRCRYVSSHFGVGVTWVSRNTRHGERWEWPPDIWSRSPRDDVLLHPAVQAVMIWCEAIQAAVDPSGYPVLWAITWRARSASWMLRHRQILERALT